MPETAQEYQARLEHEWGTYTATAYIHVDGVLAYKPGDAVPVSNVDKYHYADDNLVAKNTTKAAATAKAAPATEKGI